MDAIAKKKAALRASSERHKDAVSADLKALVNTAEKTVGSTVLTIGALLLTTAVYKMLKGKKGNKRSKTLDRLLVVLKQQVGLYILNEGRAKIVEYINTLDETES